MDSNAYQRVKELFAQACVLSADARQTFLDGLSESDQPLRDEVEALLAHDGETFPVERPALPAFGSSELDPLEGGGADAALPSEIDGYTIVRRIGAGGMGVVFEAEQAHPRRRVALKMIRPGLAVREVQRRFALEAHALGRLQHAGIARVYTTGTALVDAAGTRHPQPYLAMEYVEGEPLPTHAAARGLDLRARVALLAEICEAVAHAHEKGVVHRDLKPSNILVTPGGEPKVLDFGVARITDADVQLTTMHTDAGQLIGTLAYMSPEQVRGDAHAVDTRSDVYALGVVGFELLTGRLPIDVRGKSLPEAARLIQESEPAKLGGDRRTLRGDLQTIIATALAKDPRQRYGTAGALAADLRRFLRNEPITARPASAWYQFKKFAARQRALVGGVAAVFVVLAAGVAVSSTLAVQAEHARETADEQRGAAESARVLAEQEAERAAAAQASAEREAQRAGAVRDFLVDMLRQVSPEQARGRDTALVRALADNAAKTVSVEFADYPGIRGELHYILASVYQSVGEYEQAEEQLALAQRAVDSFEGATPRDGLTLAKLRGRILQDRGAWDEAEAVLTQAVAQAQEALGETDPLTLELRYDLIGVWNARGRPDEARAALEPLLDELSATFGPADDLVLEAKNGLALLLRQAREFARAEALLREVIEVWSARHGADYPPRLVPMKNLSVLLKDAGRFEESAELSAEVRAQVERLFGSEHPEYVQASVNLASALLETGAHARAAEVAREAVAAAEQVLGAAHADTGKAYCHLGIALRKLGDYAGARDAFEAAVAIHREALGSDHPTTISTLNSYGGLLFEQADYAEAERVLREVVEGCYAAYGARGFQTLQFETNLVSLLIKQEQAADAVALAESVVARADQAAPPGHWFRWGARQTHGNALVAAERYDEAEPLLTGCYEHYVEQFGSDNWRTKEAAGNVVNLYQQWGRVEAAEAWAARAGVDG